jgi:hypothetical protein
MSNAPTQIAPGFKRADPAIVNGHPLRGALRVRQAHETIADAEPKRARILIVRDTLISLMGAVSAMVPLVIAFQSVIGA